MGVKEDLVLSYLDRHNINRKWKGYRLLYQAILIFMEDPSSDCNSVCEKVCSVDGYTEYTARSVYSTILYAIKHSDITKTISVYQFIGDAGFDISRSCIVSSNK